MKVGVAFISDRDPDLYLSDCIGSFDVHCVDPTSMLGPRTVIDDRDHLLGMSGSVNAAWEWAVAENVDYLFHIEEDFVFRRDFSLRAMLFALTWGRHLAQIVLKRQPWSAEEAAVGNIIRLADDATEHDIHTDGLGTVQWVTHRRIFSLNPCLLPFSTFSQRYPAGNEAQMTQRLIMQKQRFAYFGGIDDGPIVEHVGHVRGTGWKL